MRIALLLVLAAFSFGSLALAAGPAPPAADVHQLQTVVVSGIQPGPGLWKVSKGDHIFWILGTVTPVPKGMQWYAPKTEAVLARTQEIIGAPGVVANVGMGGMFKMAFAMPTMLRARKNPDGKTLREVLPADLYTRWTALKKVYLANDKDVEEWRPIFAAGELYGAALKQAGLAFDNGAGKRIEKVADKRNIKRTRTVIEHQIKDPKRLAKTFAKSEMDDVACFRSMLDRLERDVAHAAEQANAWAVGNLPELTRLVQGDNMASCFEAITKNEAMRSLGMDGADKRSEAQWLQAVDTALAANHTSFGTLPVRKLLEPNGLLAKLEAKGYTVQAPE